VASEEVALPIQLHRTTVVNNLLDITTRPHTLYHHLFGGCLPQWRFLQ
jgi:hypothetical protein